MRTAVAHSQWLAVQINDIGKTCYEGEMMASSAITSEAVERTSRAHELIGQGCEILESIRADLAPIESELAEMSMTAPWLLNGNGNGNGHGTMVTSPTRTRKKAVKKTARKTAKAKTSTKTAKKKSGKRPGRPPGSTKPKGGRTHKDATLVSLLLKGEQDHESLSKLVLKPSVGKYKTDAKEGFGRSMYTTESNLKTAGLITKDEESGKFKLTEEGEKQAKAILEAEKK